MLELERAAALAAELAAAAAAAVVLEVTGTQVLAFVTLAELSGQRLAADAAVPPCWAAAWWGLAAPAWLTWCRPQSEQSNWSLEAAGWPRGARGCGTLLHPALAQSAPQQMLPRSRRLARPRRASRRLTLTRPCAQHLECLVGAPYNSSKWLAEWRERRERRCIRIGLMKQDTVKTCNQISETLWEALSGEG